MLAIQAMQVILSMYLTTERNQHHQQDLNTRYCIWHLHTPATSSLCPYIAERPGKPYFTCNKIILIEKKVKKEAQWFLKETNEKNGWEYVRNRGGEELLENKNFLDLFQFPSEGQGCHEQENGFGILSGMRFVQWKFILFFQGNAILEKYEIMLCFKL